MRCLSVLLSAAFLLTGLACNVDLSFDPSEALSEFNDGVREAGRAIEQAVRDPLDADPFPVLIGGDDQRLYYATNLGDIRINFDGPSNDIVVPGFFGPSNLYRLQDEERRLLRPLVFGSTFVGMATDGRWVAWLTNADDVHGPFSLVVTDVRSLDEEVIYPGIASSNFAIVPSNLALDDGRLVYIVNNKDTDQDLIRMEDLENRTPGRDVATAGQVISFDLRAFRLAFIHGPEDGPNRLTLVNLVTRESQVLAEGIAKGRSRVVFSANRLVWSEPLTDGLFRVRAYDFVDDTQRTLHESAVGLLVGATDDVFATEQLRPHRDRPYSKVFIRRYEEDGREREMADFRADGLAGQTLVAGQRMIWVDPDRRIVIHDLITGDREDYKPF